MRDYTELINKIDTIVAKLVDRVLVAGCYEDVTDVDSKGGERTSRFNNLTGLNELRLMRASLISEQPNKGEISEDKKIINLLQAIQDGSLAIEDLNDE
jgi:anti-sigma28 factor (negative regulator of flagellin synthesis)